MENSSRKIIIKKCKTCGKYRHHSNKDSSRCVYCNESLQVLSGNKLVDDLIKKSLTLRLGNRITYVPFEQFTNIKYLAEGGFSKIYKAIWKDGPITGWYSKEGCFTRKEREIVLKRLNNSENIDSSFLNEAKEKNPFTRYSSGVSEYQSRNQSRINNLFGITQDPQTGDFMLVIDFVKDGDLHHFLLNHNEIASIVPELESDPLESENRLNNKNQSFYNLYENMKNENSIKSNHNIHNIYNTEQFDKPNQHPKMNLNSLLNDQESNDHDFYFYQSDNLNFENIYHSDNVLLTKDVQYSAIELMSVQYSTMNLMPFQSTAMDFQYSTTDLMLFQNDKHLYFNNYSNLNSENFLKNDQVQVFDYNHVDYSMKHKNEDDQYKYQY
ncbi:16059_t:CDS:2 [Gigaspora margarita]|uniref:16059_t:CDS:1 n=1 Tax=Gigaspora margarita TaxID=4874 RepID=A0ABM8VZD6_GIGMA|nr:16059_t:CDS:2 [Gigaspora margarita]